MALKDMFQVFSLNTVWYKVYLVLVVKHMYIKITISKFPGGSFMWCLSMTKFYDSSFRIAHLPIMKFSSP